MATSGVTNYSVTELDIITDALQNIGVIGAAETSIAAEDYAVARRKLNLLMKQWTGQIDFAPGLKMWTRRRGYLFLQKDQVVYSLGPTGDECASETYVTSTLASAASGGAGTITLVSATGFSASMRIGVLLDSGSFQWTTINGAPSGAVVTLTATLTGAASAGARVFAYTSKILRPFEIQTAVMRDTNGDDSPFDVHQILEQYESVPSKSDLGSPLCGYFEAKRTNASLYIDAAPEDVTDVMRFVYLSYVEDVSATTHDIDFPAEWFRPLALQLAMDCAIPFSRSVTAELKTMRDEALVMAKNAYPERIVVEYQNEPDAW